MSSETFGEITLEKDTRQRNLMQALKKVEANKGSCGVDGMETSELRAYFKSNPGKLHTEQILQGTFKPSPIRGGFTSQKDNGGATSLGDTHGNRPLCATGAIALVLSEEYREKIFVDQQLWVQDPTGTAGKP